eukprot:g2891.t1
MWALWKQERAFLLLWLAQTCSLLSSYLCSYSLRMYVLEVEGLGVTGYAWLRLAGSLPSLLVSPLAGICIDKVPRRAFLCTTDLLALVPSLLVFAHMLRLGAAPGYSIILQMSLAGDLLGGLQGPAWLATIPRLVSPAHLSQANGLVSLSGGVAQLVVPALSAALSTYPAFGGLFGFFLVDIATCLLATSCLFFIDIPEQDRGAALSVSSNKTANTEEEEQEEEEKVSWRDMWEGWHLLWSTTELRWLSVLSAVHSFLAAFVFLLIPGIVLSYADAATFGLICSFAGTGMLLGSVCMSCYAPNARQAHLLLLAAIGIQGFTSFIALWPPKTIRIALSGWVYLTLAPVISTLIHTLLQQMTPDGVRGRVLSAFGALNGLFDLLGQLVVGPLCDRVFEPLMQSKTGTRGGYGLLVEWNG